MPNSIHRHGGKQHIANDLTKNRGEKTEVRGSRLEVGEEEKNKEKTEKEITEGTEKEEEKKTEEPKE